MRQIIGRRKAGSPPFEYVRVGFTEDERKKLEQAIQRVRDDKCDWIDHYQGANEKEFIRHLVNSAVSRILADKSPDSWLSKRLHKVGYHLVHTEWAARELHKALNEISTLKLPTRRKRAAA